jgi:hypothetical protein
MFDDERPGGDADSMIENESRPPVPATPWEEPRGPHFPDVFARIPALAWIFIVVSVVRLWVLVDTARLGPAPDPLAVGGVVTNAVGSLAVLLAPAALFIRRPKALRRAPLFAFGLMAVAVAELLQALSPGLRPVFDSVTADSELAPVAPLYLAYIGAASLVGLIGLIGVAIGLSRARRRPGRGGMAPTVVVVLAAVFLVVSRVAEASRLLTSSRDSMALTVYNVIATGIGVGTILAWAYLVLVTFKGVRAGETPAIAWRLGVMAGVLGLLAYGLFAVLTISVGPETSYEWFLLLASALFALGPAGLFLAIAAGLASLEPKTELALD